MQGVHGSPLEAILLRHPSDGAAVKSLTKTSMCLSPVHAQRFAWAALRASKAGKR